ncbi:XRE family transcriptional regulator [Pseudomonas stutzeri]|nr:XRE family transcriptional regulator [Stutzerimonas degradans]
MIKERVIQILKSSGMRLPELEARTGISRYTWNNLKNPARNREIKAEEIEAIVALHPQFALWIISGNTAPECGQISPDGEQDESAIP